MVYLIYLIVISLVIYLLIDRKLDRNKKITCVFLIFLLSIVFLGFREVSISHSVGIDAIVYRLSFENTTFNLIKAIAESGFEPGIVFLHWIVKIFTSNYYVVSVLEVSFMLVCEIVFLYHFRDNKCSLIPIFFTLMNLIEGTCIIRNAFAIHLGFIVFYYLSNEKWKESIFMAIFAILFHISALILFLVIFNIFIMNKLFKNDFKKYIYLIISECFGAFLGIQILIYFLKDTRYSYYFTNDTIAINTYLITFFLMILSFALKQAILNRNKYYSIIFKVLPIIFVCLPLQLHFSISYRFLLYLTPFTYFLFGAIINICIECFVNDKNRFCQILLSFMLVAFCIYKTMRFININLEEYGLNEYQNVIVENIYEWRN